MNKRRHTNWKQLREYLKYRDWYMDCPNWWCDVKTTGLCIQRLDDKFVRIHNNPYGQTDVSGYLDGVCVKICHVIDVLEMIYELKSIEGGTDEN